MLNSPEYIAAVVADRDREIRRLRRVHAARVSKSEAKKSEPRRKRLLRLRHPLRV
jgi:hypothetical protein